MAILRNKTQGQYVVVQMTMTKDRKLKLIDRGLLLTLLSLPDNWNLSIRGLAAILPDGKAAIEASLKRLENYGYITRYQDRSNSGTFGNTIVEIHETPVEVPGGDDPCSAAIDTEQYKGIMSSFESKPKISEDRHGHVAERAKNEESCLKIGQMEDRSLSPDGLKTLENKGFSPCTENRDTENQDTKTPCPENRDPEKRDPGKRYPDNRAQSINNKSIIHKSNIQEESTHALRQHEYEELVSEFGIDLVDYQIQKIKDRRYRNCMNYRTIRLWCQEARDKQFTKSVARKQGTNSFNNFEQRQYDYDQLEKDILEAQRRRMRSELTPTGTED